MKRVQTISILKILGMYKYKLVVPLLYIHIKTFYYFFFLYIIIQYIKINDTYLHYNINIQLLHKM